MTNSPLQRAIDYLITRGYRVTTQGGRFYLHNSEGKVVNPNPKGMSAKSLVAQANYERDQSIPKRERNEQQDLRTTGIVLGSNYKGVE